MNTINQPDEHPDMATYKLRDIKPNPFRHIERYPIRRDKVMALIESFRVTGYWGNIVARPAPDGDGAEIAYGHHRLAALREEYKEDQDIALLVRALPDEQMLQIMARENMEEWGTSAVVEQETVRAVIEAYADGLIELPHVKAHGGQLLREAPSFRISAHARAEKSYSTEQIVAFLGWGETKIRNTLNALQLVEEGILSDSDFEGLSTKAAEAVTIEARRAADERERTAQIHQKQADSATDERMRHHHHQQATKAREEGRRAAVHVGKTLSQKLKAGTIGARGARDEAEKINPRVQTNKPLPNIDKAAVDLCGDILDFLDPERDFRGKRLAEIIQYSEHLSPLRRDELVSILIRVADRLNAFAGKLSSKPQAIREAING